MTGKPRVIRLKTFGRVDEATKARVAGLIAKARNGNWGFWEGRLDRRVEARLKELALNPQMQEVRFLDAGAGVGRGVVLAAGIHPKVNAWGLALNPPASGIYDGKTSIGRHILPGARELSGRWVEGSFENIVLPDYFDVIQSTFGLQHALNHTVAIENMLNSLRRGGSLHFTSSQLYPPGRARNFKQNRLVWEGAFGELEKQGFEVSRPPEAKLLTGEVAITRTNLRKADLSAFHGNGVINLIPLPKREPSSAAS